MTPVHLRCEYLVNPLGLDVAAPRLFWQLDSGKAQSAYRVIVSRTEETLARDQGDLWDSGKVESPESAHITYGGPALGDLQTAYWKVMAWDPIGVGGSWSEVARWESGISSWTAEWIGDIPLGGPQTTAPVSYLRKEFSVTKTVASARLAVTALGLVEPHLNGAKVGDDHLAPGWTNYRKRVRYRVYDVTNQVQSGANCLAAMLGDGWFCGHVEWRGRQLYGDSPAMLAELHLTYADGSTEVVKTDLTWKTAYGEFLEADLLMGVSVDHRRSLSGWDQPGQPNGEWRRVRLATPLEGMVLEGWRSPTVRATQEIVPLTVAEVPRWPSPDYVFDLGQNMVGHIRLRAKGEAGKTLKVRYAERLDKNGRLYTENLRSARQTDVFTFRGDPEGEVFEPRFTFHGFQYVGINGDCEPLSLESVTGVVLHSDLPRTGDFECSDPLVNQLQKNIDWGWRGNSVDVPTDCPQRDERLGWTGDAQVFARTAAFNRDAAGFFAKYVQDLEDAQSPEGAIPPVAPNTSSLDSLEGDGGPAWADAFLIVPWTVFQCYGDRAILERHYPAMKRYVGFLKDRSVDLIRSHPQAKGFSGFGDWLSTDAVTPNDLIGTAFFAHSAYLLSRIAREIGRDGDAVTYQILFEQVRRAFRDRFVTPDGLIVAGTQTAYVLALHFDLLETHHRPKAVQALVDDIGRRGWKLSTGFVGTPYLPHVLTEGGRADVAYKLLMQKAWPSYLYAVTKGATTIWERWDGWTEDKGYQDAGMNSFNHYAYGAVGEWLYSRVAGLDLSDSAPGHRELLIRPTPGEGLDYAAARLNTLYGEASVRWDRDGEGMRLAVTVPPGCTARILVPAPEDATIVVEGDVEPLGYGTYRQRHESVDRYHHYMASTGSCLFRSSAISVAEACPK